MLDIHSKILKFIRNEVNEYMQTLPAIEHVTYVTTESDDDLLNISMNSPSDYSIRICDVLYKDVPFDTIVLYKHFMGTRIILSKRSEEPTEENLKKIIGRIEKKSKSVFTKKNIEREFDAIDEITESFETITAEELDRHQSVLSGLNCDRRGIIRNNPKFVNCDYYKMEIDDSHTIFITIKKIDRQSILKDAGMSRTDFYKKHEIKCVSMFMFTSSVSGWEYSLDILPSSVKTSIKQYINSRRYAKNKA